uniref:NADH-ubiquinone oxidoreductase chain 5 n=1 Tax=Neaxius glyptocercus TaxID=576631 RepID=K4EYC8_NEAGL|nr:NADH dehydrogenase subunit 5 [Neaxius glyptocercus]AEW68317.1 NADH dehydrogenase subunit 5 [Neaxius glyptocercus]
MTWKVQMHLASMVFLVSISVTSFLGSLFSLLMNFTLIVEWEIVSVNSCILMFTLIIDWVSCMFLSFVCFISAMVLFYSGSYMEGDKSIDRFLFLVLAFVFSMGALILSPNIVSILLGWDGLGLVSYALVIYYQNEKSANAGMLTILSNRIGDVAILLSISLFFTQGGWNFITMSEFLSDKEVMLKMLIILAAMTKSAQIPFSAWLPAAMAAPTPVSALVHSSTLVTAGVYLLVRFSPALENSKVQSFLLIISALTMFMAGLGANFEFDLKKIIALSTLSQLGVMISILALGFPTIAFFHLLTHALFKALLFMCAGVIIHNVKDHQDIRFMGSLSIHMPLTITCMNIANLALCGAPFMAGFYSKDLILEVAFMSNINVIAFLLYAFATGLTVCYTLRLIYLSLTGVFNLGLYSSVSDNATIMTYPMVMLSLGGIIGGSALSWLILPDPYMICLTFGFKTLALSVSILGALAGYILSFTGICVSIKSSKIFPITVFSGSMWFMPSLSTMFTSLLVLKTSESIQNSMDKGWAESLGGQGIFKVAMSGSSNLQSLQDSSIKLYMKSFMLWVLIVALYMM